MSKITSPAITVYSLHDFALSFETLWPEICKLNNLTYSDAVPLYYYLCERAFLANVRSFSDRPRPPGSEKFFVHDVYENIFQANESMYRSWLAIPAEALQKWSEQYFKLTVLGNVLFVSPEIPWT